ncbi:hypothetical protein [uncultured Winogradskyella sp.]|uniref:hypothetical protein n=1 Tax=uncultured Winogradskyella sp. TaxID=395353 RepID=UPI00262344E5|nr:hypothetical protein [uncultured Winogradskyella sp.]
MKFIPKTENGIALASVAVLTFSFFFAGIFDILDYFIVQVLIFLGFGALFFAAVNFALKNDSKKNRPEDKLQDDLH